jgi:hypothetical protein
MPAERLKEYLGHLSTRFMPVIIDDPHNPDREAEREAKFEEIYDLVMGRPRWPGVKVMMGTAKTEVGIFERLYQNEPAEGSE